MNLQVHVLGRGNFEPKLHLFSGGEPHVTLDPAKVSRERVWVEAHIGNAVDFGYLLCTLDAIRRARPDRLALYLPYFPGGRQDHPEPGTPHTLSIYANALRFFGLWGTLTVDPHSYATVQALPGTQVLMPHEIVPPGYQGIIAPDMGGLSRAAVVARKFGIPLVKGHKKRAQATGKLSDFKIGALPETGRYLVVDDICDGGATFIGLAEAVEASPSGKVSILDLYVSHGIFSKGFEELFKHYEKIITTDAFPRIYSDEEIASALTRRVNIISLETPVHARMEAMLESPTSH